MNNLELINDFEKIIPNYVPSKESIELLENIKLALLIAPSSTGRNTIINELVKEDSFQFIVTDTTRLPRINNGVEETDGIEYWFKTEEEFLSGLKAGKYLEAEIIHSQQVSGISIRELVRAHEHGKIAITDIDIGGVESVIKYKKDATIIMLLPPSFDEWLRRLMGRGEMPEIEIIRRLNTALKIFKAGLEKDYFSYVINVNSLISAKEIDRLSSVNHLDSTDSKIAKELIKQLILDTKEYLSKK